MILLSNVLKQSAVVFTGDVYKIEITETEPAPAEDHRSDESSAADIVIPPKIDEEKIWNQLKERIEEERDKTLKAAKDEALKIRTHAYSEGYEQGLRERMDQIQALIEKNERILRDISTAVTQKLQEIEENLTGLSVEIASKILARKLDEDDRCMTELIRKAVDEVRNSEWITVTLSNEMKQVLGELEDELRRGRPVGKLEFSYREVPKGTCIVESSDGVIDASIWTQIENLKDCIL